MNNEHGTPNVEVKSDRTSMFNISCSIFDV